MQSFKNLITRTPIFVTLAMIAALAPSTAGACSPAKLTPKQIIENADLIVIARAARSKWEVADYEPGPMSDLFNFFYQFAPDKDSWTEGETKFKIQRTLKGDAGDTVTIRHDVSPTACGVTFDAFDNYLLFVDEHKNKYFISVFGVRPYLSAAEYDELFALLGVGAEDRVKFYEDYLEPADAVKRANGAL